MEQRMILEIAFRNTLRQKRRTILTALTMFGGFTLASISIGWSDGSYSYIINMFTRNRLGHIQIHREGYLDKPSLYDTIDKYTEVGRIAGGIEGVQAWAPRLLAAGLASVDDKSSAVQITGIDPAMENAATRFEKKIVDGRTLSPEPSHQAVLGKGLAEVLRADVGDELVIVSQAADGSIANDLYTITGLADAGDEIANRMSIYLHLKDAQELFVLEGSVHEIVIIVDDIDRVRELSDKIRNELDNPDLDIAPWQEFARSFYQAMRADQQGTWISLFIITMIVAVGVLNTVLMSVLERTKEYGVQLAMGTRPAQIFTQIVLEVLIIAGASCVVGIGLSVLANHILSIHGLTLPTAFTYGGVEFKTMYSEVNARSLYIPGITVLVSAFLVSLFPALRAARIRAATAMKTN
jgi:ABC-type lipoprotein release transport system permease subunit